MKTALPYPPPWQDAATLCAHLCISERTLDEWVRQGILPAPRRRGGIRRWNWGDVQKHLRGRVYFIESGAFIKIGFTESLKSRLATLTSSSAHPIETLLVVRGSRAFEARLHSRFKHLRVHGEWFRKEPELLAHIDGLRPWSI